MSSNLLYSKNNIGTEYIHDPEYDYSIWLPGINNLLPPNKGIKYLLYTLFYVTRIFKNRNYFGVNMYFKKENVASLLVVPAYFRWPFMGKRDVQIIYVMTKTEYRGKGLALKMINFALSKLPPEVNKIWYVTDENNLSSQRVAEKLNFRLDNQTVK